MKILTLYKVLFLALFTILTASLTGCMHHTVVSSHPVAHTYKSKVLISSNSAYYERYGYPTSYRNAYYEPYHPAKTVVVKQVKVLPVKTGYKTERHHPKPIKPSAHAKPRHADVKNAYRNNESRHTSMPIKRHEKPRLMTENKPVYKKTEPQQTAYANKEPTYRQKPNHRTDSKKERKTRESERNYQR